MSMFNWQRILGLGFAAMILLVTSPSAQAQTEDAAKKADEPTEKKPSAGASLTDVEFLLALRERQKEFDEAASAAILPGSTRIKPKFDEKKLPEATVAANNLLEAMDKILASDRVATLRKDETQVRKLSFLYEAVRLDPTTFTPIRDAYLGELFDRAKKDEGEDRRISSLLAAYKLKEEFVDSDKPKEKTRAALEEFRKEYPRSALGLNLYMAWANNLVENGDIPGAIEAYKTIKGNWHEPKLAILDSLIYRLEMVGKPAELSGPGFDGAEFDIAKWKGKVVLVDFWASWCGPCVDRFDSIKRIYEKYHDKGFEVVGISLDDKRDDVKATLERYTLPWPNIFFEPKEGEGRSFENPLATKLQINYLPAMFLVDREGKYIGSEYIDLNKLENAIALALGLPGPIPDPEPPKEPAAEAPAEEKPNP